MNEPTTTLDFTNTQLAFQAKSDRELKRTYWLYRAIDSPFLTKIGPQLLIWAFRLGLPIERLVKKTLFDLFIGGVSIKDTLGRSQALYAYGIFTILDYSVEGDNDKDSFDATAQEIMATLAHGASHPEVAFSACKLSGLTHNEVLAKVQEGKVLTEQESVQYQRFLKRVNDICAAAARYRTPIFIDAEESWMQNTIDQVAEAMMETYNREWAAVHTTVQLYRHDRLAYLRSLIQRSKEGGYVLGVKLVRGAYLEKERARARQLGYADPMQPDKASTDRDFDAAARLCLDHLEHVAVCLGTHNQRSTQLLAEEMISRQLPPDHPHVVFAQLLGMSDHISFNLAHHGFRAAKYLPYGPVKAVLPYMIRRAQENTAIAGQSSREVSLLKEELARRRQAAPSSAAGHAP